jgi:ankyrin repeat protein
MGAVRIGTVALLTAWSVFTAADHVSPDAGLFCAIRAGDIQGIRDSLHHGAEADAGGDHEATPLLWAAQYCTLQCPKLVHDSSADPNGKNAFGATARMWGAGDVAKVKLLLAKGADVNAQASPAGPR